MFEFTSCFTVCNFEFFDANLGSFCEAKICVVCTLSNTRKYPLRGYILGSGAPGSPGVIGKTYGTTFISDNL